MSVVERTVDKMFVDTMAVEKMSVANRTVEKMSVDRMIF
jgi:hypothetical protein